MSVTAAHSGAEGIATFERMRPDIVLLDVRLPDMTGFDVLARIRDANPVVIMVTGYGDVALAVQAMQNGAENFLTKPVDLAHLGAVAERAFEKARLRQMNRYLTSRHGTSSAELVLGVSRPMQELAAQIDMVAASDRTTVLLIGESGSGKGRVAELIHARSPRAPQPFVEVNCAALSATSLDVELFGQDRSGAEENGVNAHTASSNRDSSRSPTAAPCSSTRSPIWRRTSSPSSCGFSRGSRFAASAARRKSWPTRD